MARIRISVTIPEELEEKLKQVRKELAEENHFDFSRSKAVEKALNMLIASHQKKRTEKEEETSEE